MNRGFSIMPGRAAFRQEMGVKIRILLVDDHAMFRESLRAIIENHNDMEVVAEAENGLSAVAQVHKFKPDIVIMDIRMPVLNGIEATRRIISKFPKTKIIALSSHSDAAYVEGILQAGASDYQSKVCSRDELIKCIYRIWAQASA
jgi:DNA-binding NarL/FixJ family response regulator